MKGDKDDTVITLNLQNSSFESYLILFSISEFSLRLVGGSNQREGLVEVAIGNKWGTICTTNYDIKAAHVICRQLGLSYAVTMLLARDYIQEINNRDNSGPVHFCNLSCSGNEDNIERCSFTKVHEDYPHSNDISVICSDRGTPSGKLKVTSRHSL